MLQVKEPVNKNYCAIVVKIEKLVPLANCDNVQGALIFGNHVIVGKDVKVGDVGLFFPVETALSAEFLSNNNLYRENTMNKDTTKKGYFEQNGRVRAVKFRGHKSEGFFVELDAVLFAAVYWDMLEVGQEFDELNGVPICYKYISRKNPAPQGKRQGRKASPKERIVDGQFHFHVDTPQLRRTIGNIFPEDEITITDKWHGASGIFANLLVKRQLTWWEKALRRIGVRVEEKEYQKIWASRRVVKGVGDEAKDAVHFYGADIWKSVLDRTDIPAGYTVYGEIVGWTDTGAFIQPGYHYGCLPGCNKLVVYRITLTNWEGKVLELDWLQMADICNRYMLEMVPTLFRGKAKELLYWSEDETLEQWQQRFLAYLESVYVNDSMCPYNDYEVPQEGIVLRVEKPDACEVYKLKNFAFLERESKLIDSGQEDIEEKTDDL